MQPVLNVEDIKKVEHHLADVGVSISELMHRAGLAVGREVVELKEVSTVTVMCGFGNNAGDGWVAAAYLLKKGCTVTVVTPVETDELQADLIRVCAKSAEAQGVAVVVAPPREELEELLFKSDVVIDAMFGTGFRGFAHEPFSIWIDCVNESAARVVAVDVPSGLSAQTGLKQGNCIIADLTVTMIALKPGLLCDDARDVVGAIVVAPLAEQSDYLVREADPVAWRVDFDDYADVIPQPSKAHDKYSRGTVLVVAGSARFPGAAIMAALACARAGAGYVTLAVPESIAALAQSHLLDIPVLALPASPEGTFGAAACETVAQLAPKFDACLIGPGMRVNAHTVSIVSALLTSNVPLVVDADGLNCIARLTGNKLDKFPELIRRNAPLILTPHRKELARLVGLEKEPLSTLSATLEAARRIVWSDGGSELVVMAKSSATACVSTDVALLPKPGPACLATAGTGDVLAGITASLLAQSHVTNEELVLLASYACELHGASALLAQKKFGETAVMAHDLLNYIGLAAQDFGDSFSQA